MVDWGSPNSPIRGYIWLLIYVSIYMYLKNMDYQSTITNYGDMGLSENVVYPIVPNGFADHYPVFKWLFHWEYTLFSDKPILYGCGSKWKTVKGTTDRNV